MEQGTGYLRTYVGSDITSLPIPYAIITVYDDSNQILFQAKSDQDGMIFKTPLPTPKRSETPPYIRYRVCASAPLFQEKEISIPFFENVTSYQTFLLSPNMKKDVAEKEENF